MKRFWKLYKRTLFALETFCRLRPSRCHQLTIIEHSDYDTLILPAIADISESARIHTNSSGEDYKLFRVELTKLEKFNDRILSRNNEKSKHCSTL